MNVPTDPLLVSLGQGREELRLKHCLHEAGVVIVHMQNDEVILSRAASHTRVEVDIITPMKTLICVYVSLYIMLCST